MKHLKHLKHTLATFVTLLPHDAAQSRGTADSSQPTVKDGGVAQQRPARPARRPTKEKGENGTTNHKRRP
jgi:hypothetical protein